MSSSSVKSSRSRANSQMFAKAWQSRHTARNVPARTNRNSPSCSGRSQWWQTATTVGVRGAADADASVGAGRRPGRAVRDLPRFGERAFGGGPAFDRMGNIRSGAEEEGPKGEGPAHGGGGGGKNTESTFSC